MIITNLAMFDSLREIGDDPDMPMIGRFFCQSIYGWLSMLVVFPVVAYKLIRLFVFCIYALWKMLIGFIKG